MFATAFDLTVADAQKHHPKGVARAYSDIKLSLAQHGAGWVQGSLYVSQSEDLAKLFAAISPLKNLPWFPESVCDIRAFRVEQWSVGFHVSHEELSPHRHDVIPPST